MKKIKVEDDVYDELKELKGSMSFSKYLDKLIVEFDDRSVSIDKAF